MRMHRPTRLRSHARVARRIPMHRAAWLLPCLLTGCFREVPDADVVGVYREHHPAGYITFTKVVYPDHTFELTMRGCMGILGYARGRWTQVDGDDVLFYVDPDDKTTMAVWRVVPGGMVPWNETDPDRLLKRIAVEPPAAELGSPP